MKILLIIFLFILFLLVCFLFYKPLGDLYLNKRKNDYEKRSDNYKNHKFHNPTNISVMSGKKSEYVDEKKIPDHKIPVHYLDSIPDAFKDELKWIWLGHSSSLLQIDGKNILIDPVFNEYTSPVSGIGPKRFSDSPITIDKLHHIDICIISHDHYDHLDYKTIRKLRHKVDLFIVPSGVERHLLRWKVKKEKIINLTWWESYSIDDLTITSVPGRHFTGRLPWLSNETLWCGFVFKTENYQVYYTGDTGYGNHFKDIYQRLGKMDLMIIENGQYDQAWSAIHMLPEDHVKAIKDVDASWVIPVHWGTFCICNHSFDDPIRTIYKLCNEHDINLATPMIGEIVDFKNIHNYKETWWKDLK